MGWNAGRLVFFFAIYWLAGPGRAAPEQPALLEPEHKMERQLSGGQSHEYRFALEAGQYARVVVEQRSINVGLALTGPDGKEMFAIDTFLADEPEYAEIVAEVSGEYRFRVNVADATAPPGIYTITLSQPVSATPQHRNRAAAALTYAKASLPAATPSSRESLLNMIPLYEAALQHWQAAGDQFEEARTLYSAGIVYGTLGNREKAVEYTTRALPIARASSNPRSLPWALFFYGEVFNAFGDRRKAIEYYHQSLPLMQKNADRAGQTSVLNGLGTAYARTGEKRKAIECLQQALELASGLQDRGRIASIAGNIGVTYSDLAEYSRALEYHQRSLALAREIRNRQGEATTLNNMGTCYSSISEYQQALDVHTAALEINRSLDSPWHAATNLHNIAWVYASLGDRARAMHYYQEAIDILRGVKDQWGLGHSLNNVAELYADSGNYAKALELHNEGLAFRRNVGDADGEGTSLTNIGKIHTSLRDWESARRDFEAALAILRKSGDKRQLTGALRGQGILLRQTGELERAQEFLEEALALSRSITDRRGEAKALAELAKVVRDRGDLAKAREHADESLAVLESLRLTVGSPALRASFFSAAREVQELELDVLLRLHREKPTAGFDEAALSVVERGRARSLLELLGESSAEIRKGVDATLLERERELARLINAKAERQVKLLSRKHTEEDAAAARKELDLLVADLEQVQSKIRKASPHYAALTQPTPLTLKEIQRSVLDSDTMLLEYSLGTEHSFLWAITNDTAEVFVLPPRADIETAARRAYDLLTARNQKLPNETPAARTARLRQSDDSYLPAAEQASAMLLGPVAARLGSKRLLIVGEGVLQYLPFAALPEPSERSDTARRAPLSVKHEIVMAPSASVIAVLRRETPERKPAEKALAVLADPVFSADDGRISKPGGPLMTVAAKMTSEEATRPAQETGAAEFARLRFSRYEAEEIARRFPAELTLKALDFDASRETVLKPDFGNYRIVHFATHSLLNDDRPELSGVVLSRFDSSGRSQNGYLRLHEIYNLRLASDLVVLSACKTALGGEIKGEGLIGLTRGFLYAGAPRVVASLWEVDDRTSAELMRRFYEGMLTRGERPAAALRAAQVEMWKTKGWETPYYWAAYTLQGEWR